LITVSNFEAVMAETVEVKKMLISFFQKLKAYCAHQGGLPPMEEARELHPDNRVYPQDMLSDP
jgi:hypothetical protein